MREQEHRRAAARTPGDFRGAQAGIVVTTVAAALFAFSAPWSIAGGQIAMGLSLVAIVAAILLRAGNAYPPPRTLLLVLLFLVIQAVSIPLGIHPGRSLRFFPHYSWVLLFPWLFWFLLGADRTRDRALAVLGGSGALAGLYGTAQHFTTAVWFQKRIPESLPGGGYIAVGTLGHHLTYGGVVLPIFFLALGRALDAHGPRPRALWGAAALGLALGVVFSYARTAWIGLMAGLLLFGLLRGRRWFVVAAGAMALVVALGLVIEPSLRARAGTLLASGDDPRLRLWQTALRMAADHPILGAGIGSFGSLFEQYKVPGWYMAHGHPHSDPLNYLVETGIIGLACWAAIWAMFFIDTGRGLSRRSATLDGLRCASAALLVAGLGQCFSSDEEVAMTWWFLVAAALLMARSERRRAGAGA